MKTTVLSLTKISIITFVAMILALTSLVAVSAQEDEQSTEAETTSEEVTEDSTEELTEETSEESAEETSSETSEESTEESSEDSNNSYAFVAQPGDSYSKIARKATQIYGFESSTDLTLEEIMFVETNLTIQAGSPELNVGQEVAISKSDVENWVNQARELSDEAEAAWTQYVVLADFNTDNVGEAQE